MNLVELAERIKAKRLERRLTLEQVASRTGLTRSWLSKVENFRITPSLPALGEIAEALGVKIADLVEGIDVKPRISIVRSDERKLVERDRPDSKIVYESLAHKRPQRMMDPFLLSVPAGIARKTPMAHEGEEFLMAVEGNVDLEYAGTVHHLNEGDCVYFDASAAHRLINSNAHAVKVLSVFHAPNLR